MGHVVNIENIEKNAEKAAALLKALSNPKRLMIVCALHKCEKNVGELEKIIGLSQSALSQHLAWLRRDGLVKGRRNAQTIHYSLGNEAVQKLLSCLHEIFCPDFETEGGDSPG